MLITLHEHHGLDLKRVIFNDRLNLLLSFISFQRYSQQKHLSKLDNNISPQDSRKQMLINSSSTLERFLKTVVTSKVSEIPNSFQKYLKRNSTFSFKTLMLIEITVFNLMKSGNSSNSNSITMLSLIKIQILSTIQVLLSSRLSFLILLFLTN